MFGLLTGNATLTAFVPVPRWYGAGAVVDSPVKPFVVLRWLAPVRSDARGSFLNQLRIDVHQERGGYALCDAFLAEVQPFLKEVADYVGADGRLTQCDYLGHSGDQEDPEYRSNYKFSSWQVIGVNL